MQVIKTKTEIATIMEFLAWLEKINGDNKGNRRNRDDVRPEDKDQSDQRDQHDVPAGHVREQTDAERKRLREEPVLPRDGRDLLLADRDDGVVSPRAGQSAGRDR